MFIAVGVTRGRKSGFKRLLSRQSFATFDQNAHEHWSFADLKLRVDEWMRLSNLHIYVDAVFQTKCARRSLADMALRRNFQVVFLVFTTQSDLFDARYECDRAHDEDCFGDCLSSIEIVKREEEMEYPQAGVSFITVKDTSAMASNMNQRA